MKMEKRKALRVALMVLLVTITIGCDRISKEVVRSNVLDHEYIRIVQDNVVITRVENTGAALSLGAQLPATIKLIVLQILPGLVLLYLFWILLVRSSMSTLTSVGLAFIIGGGIGNIFDRFMYGSVTDFMFLKLGILKTGIFNVADLAVVLGTVLIIIQMTFLSRKRKLALRDE